MKKVLLGMALGSLMLGAISFSALAIEPEEVLGTWYLTELSFEGVSVPASMFGMNITIELLEDGSAVLTAVQENFLGMDTEDESEADTEEESEEDNAEIIMGSWTIDGDYLYVDDGEEPMPLLLEDDALITTSVASESADEAETEEAGDGTPKMIFKRTPDAGNEFVPAEEVAAEDITDFDGTWSVYMLSVGGMSIAASTMDELADTKILIDGGVFSADNNGESSDEEVFEFEDGRMILKDDEQTATVTLLEDGMLCVNYADEYMMYLVPAEEE